VGKRFVLSEYKEKIEQESMVEIDLGDDNPIKLRPMALWTDEMLELAQANDNLGLAQKIVGGESEWQRFVSAGGSVTLIYSILAESMGLKLDPSELGKLAARSTFSKNTEI